MNSAKSIASALGVVALLLWACKEEPKPVEQPNLGQPGQVETSVYTVYTNAYFDLTVPISSTWKLHAQEWHDQLVTKGAEAVAGQDARLKAALQASMSRERILFTASRDPDPATPTFRPSIMLIAEPVRDVPSITTGQDYLKQVRSMLAASQLKMIPTAELYTRAVGGLTFDAMDVTAALPSGPVKETYYSRVIKDYALTLIVVFKTQEHQTAIRNILDGIKFGSTSDPQ